MFSPHFYPSRSVFRCNILYPAGQGEATRFIQVNQGHSYAFKIMRCGFKPSLYLSSPPQRQKTVKHRPKVTALSSRMNSFLILGSLPSSLILQCCSLKAAPCRSHICVHWVPSLPSRPGFLSLSTTAISGWVILGGGRLSCAL